MNALVNGSFNVDTLGTGRRALAVKFFPQPTPVTVAEGEIRMESRICIALGILGESTVTKRLATDRDKQEYAAAWKAFDEGREPPLSGTPIEDLPGITERIAALAAIHGIRTIEQMAGDQRAAMAMGMEGREWAARAKAWLEAKAGAAALDQAAALAAMQAQIERMTAAMAAMQTQIEVKDAALSALKQVTGQPAGPQVTKVDRADDFGLAGLTGGSDPMSDGDGLVDSLDVA